MMDKDKNIEKELLPSEENILVDKLSVKEINIAALGFLILPFGNLLFPYLLWRKTKGSDYVDRQVRLILNFQILWTLSVALVFLISPFIINLLRTHFRIYYPIGFIIIPIAFLINFIVIFKISRAIEKGKDPIIQLPFHLL